MAPVRCLPDGVDMEKYVADIERSLLQAALAQSNGVQTRAAEVLKISYRSFRHLVKKYATLAVSSHLSAKPSPHNYFGVSSLRAES